MATVAELTNALSQADKAGDTKAANFFASEIRKQQAAPSAVTSTRNIAEDYSIPVESIKALGAGTIQPLLSAMGGIATASGEIVEQGRVPFVPQGPAAAYSTFPMPSQALTEQAGTGEALDYAQGFQDFARKFPTEVMNIDKRFINNHPYIYGSMSAIGQFAPNLATGGSLILPQLYSEYNMEAERRLGKPRNEWTSEERGQVDLNAMPYLALGTVLEYVGLQGVVGKPVQAFLRGETIKADALQRAFRSVIGGMREGATEYGQTVLQDISQIVANLDPEEEITFDTFVGQDKRVAAFSGFVGGTSARGILETAEAVSLPRAEDANAELLFDSKYTVRYVDKNGNPVQFDVDGPDQQTVLRRVQENGDVMEGSPIQVTPYKGTTGSAPTQKESKPFIEDTKESALPEPESEETAFASDPQPVSIERVREQANLTQSFAKDTAAFYDFYIRELKQTGNLLKAAPRNINAVASQMVKDTSQFLADNPHLASFYEADTELTNSYLGQAFDLVQGDEKLYAIIDGLMSANTKLAGNAIDSIRAFQSYKENGNFDDMVLGTSAKGNVNYNKEKSKYVLHGTSAPGKARAVKAVGKLLNEMSVEETVNYLTTPVDYNELVRFNKYLGYKTNPGKGAIATTVQTATGQDQKFPRVFVFGPKVGSYVMNNLGYLNYTTVDIWESRFIRSYFKGMLDETKDLPETVDERDFFQKVGDQFKIEYEAETGQKITKATAQALRWFYVLDTFAKLGYKGASTNESKSEYTREGIRKVLGVDLPSGRPSREESAGAARIESVQAGSISPVLRSRFSIRRNYNQISYRGRESTDPRRGYTDTGRGNIDLEVSDFVKEAKANKKSHPYGSSVDVLSENDYQDHTLILYRSTEGGTVTASISENGELGTITATKGKTTRRDVQNTIMAAIGTGRVRWANAFDTVLGDLYTPLGFKPVTKLKFDPEQAPKDWDTNQYSRFNNGRPDIVFFTFDGEFNRQYSNFKDIPVVDDYVTAVDSVLNTEVTGENFKNPGELMDTILEEFTPIAKKIGVELEADLSGPPAIYVAWSPSKRRGKYITFNPYTLNQRSREGVRAAIREELIHGVWHEIALRIHPNEKNIGVSWSKMMTGFGKSMTQEQRNTLQSVYSTLPDLSAAKDELELNNIYKGYGAEYTRVAFQHLLFDETPEMFVEGGAAWNDVTKLFRQAQQTLGDKLNLKEVRTDMNLAQLVLDSVDVIRNLDISSPVANESIVQAAYASVPERKQSKPLNAAQNFFNGYMVPFHRNLEDIHPIFKQLEIDLNFNIIRKSSDRKERAKRFINKFLEVTDPKDLARLAHFISFNPRTEEELTSPFGQYNLRSRNEELKKHGLYDDYKEIIRPMMDQFYQEGGQLGIKSGFRYLYYPRYIKDYKGLRQALDPRNLGAFETLVDEENAQRRKVGQEQMTEDERAALLTQFLRGGLRTKPIGVSLPQNTQQRLIDIIPQELTQYYDHPAHALIRYIDNMTDTLETLKVYGQYKMDPNGNGALTGEFGRQALRLYERGQISSYELNERLPEMIKTKLATKGKTQGVEFLPLRRIRAMTYMMTIGKFSTAFANILDLEVALKGTGPVTTMKAIITNNNVDLKKMGILAGKDQNEFNFDADKFSDTLNKNLQLTGFYSTDAFGKRSAANAYLIQARSRAKKPLNSKEYRRLERDIDLFFPMKGQADKQNLIKDLRLDAPESIAVFNYIFAKMSNIQPLSEANYPPFYLQYPQLRFFWQLQTFAINRLNYNRKEYIDDLTSGDAKRAARGANNLVQMAVCLMLIGVPWEALMSFMKGQPFYLSNAVLNSLARLGYGNIYSQKKLILEGPFSFLASLVTPAGLVVGEAMTDAYKVVTGQKSWKDADAIKRTMPFKELWDLLTGERDEAYKRTWKREAKKDNFPLLNSDYLGGR